MNTYIYKGQKVFLAYTDNVPGVNPIRVSGLIGCYPIEEYNGCRTCFTIDEVYLCKCDSEDEIVDAECMNFENEQALAEGWYTKHYAEIDKFERELCVKTTDYHCWTSELTRLIRAIWDKQEEHVIPKWWADSERESWKETVDSYRKQISDDNQMDTPDVMTFDEILEQEGIGIESE